MAFYHTCKNCSANLDFGEFCDCQYPKVRVFEKDNTKMESLEWTGKNYADMEDFLNRRNFYYDFNVVKGGLVLKTQEKDYVVNIGQSVLKAADNTYSVCDFSSKGDI